MDKAFITFLITIASFLFAFVYTFIILTIPLFKSRRIQSSHKPLLNLYRRLPLILFNMALTTLSACLAVYYFKGIFNTLIPSFGIFVLQFTIIVIFDDIYFYFYHLLLHKVKFLYRKIHSIHHLPHAPFPLELYYFHPLELIGTSLGILIGFTVVYLIFGTISIYTFWGYYCLRTLHEIDVHSGIKSAIFKWLPFYGSTEHHDTHHSHVKGNYGSFFCFLDRIFKTIIKNKTNN